jgi:hypothetical protein
MENIIQKLKSSLPIYTTIQPSTGKLVKYRPITVKEEKVLLISKQTGNHEDFLATISSVVDGCFELTTPGNELPIFDVEYFFLKLRSKSINEIANPTIICPETGESIKLTVNLDDIEPTLFSNHSKEIKINNGFIITMRYPTTNDLLDFNSKEFNYYDMLIKCIVKIESDSEIIETKNYNEELVKEFVDTLTKQQFQMLLEFFKTSPKIELEVPYQASDGKQRTIKLKGIKDFFQ